MKRFSGSMIGTYKECPRMYYYRYVKELVPKRTSTKLLLGRGVHIALAAFYMCNSADVARAAYTEWVDTELEQQLEQNDYLSQDLLDAKELGSKMLEGYYTYAAQNDDFTAYKIEGSPMLEVKFDAPVWSPSGGPRIQSFAGKHTTVKHVGTFDGIVKDVYGRLWLLEHKTAQNFPSELMLRLDEQTGLYLYAARQLLDEPLAGVIYNVIRKVDPKKARAESIKRWKIPRNDQEIACMRDRLYYTIRDISRDKSFQPSPGQYCTWKCAYTQLCVCYHDGSDAGLLEDTFYERTTDRYASSGEKEE